MGKNKSRKQNAGQEAKQQLHGTKGGSIKKNKDLKFKNTPMSKAALINHLKTQDKNVSSQKNVQKDFAVAKNQNQKLPKQAFRNNAKQLKQDSPNGKQKSPSKAQNQKKFSSKNKLENVDDSSSDDEGITSQEDVSLNKTDETFEDEDDSDTDVPDILGKSLGDETDEDDEDFEDEQEEEEEEDEEDDDSDEEETIEHKGVKMFKGLEFKAKKNDKEQKNDDDNDDDDESDESMEFGENDEDDDDDDEEDEDDDDDEDEDEDEDDEDDNNDRKQTKNIKESSGEINTSLMETDEDDDDDEDEDEDEDEDDEDEDDYDDDAKMGLKALIGNSILDDDDDEDFNEEDEDDEDDDISSEDEDDEESYNVTATKAVTKEKVLNKKNASKETQMEKEKKKVNSEEQEQLEKRTILIDNIPKQMIEEELKGLFNQFGVITRIRLGSFLDMASKVESPEKRAARTRQMHPKLTTLVGNIVYTTEKSALAAVKARNGSVFEGNYLTVQTVARSKEKHDEEKSIFLANLKWGIGDNEIWKIFRKCGEIERVHLKRDIKTGQDMGFGQVNFYTKDAVALALKLDGVEIMGRPIKVLPFWNFEQRQAVEKKNKKHGTKRTLLHRNDKSSKKFKNNSEESVASNFEYERNIKKHKKQQETQYSEEKSTAFQGQKVDLKNKKKNKLDKKKKKMAEKLTAKSAKV